MLGLVITLAAAAAPMPPAALDNVACGEGPAACELIEEVAPRDRAYATPAVIDCRRELVPLVLATLVGECDGTPRDTSYRVSRTPDAEGAGQTVAPASREKRAGVATCGGMPPRAPGLQLLDAQALTLVGPTPVLPPAATVLRHPRDALDLRTRFIDPPERPPRV